MIVIKSNQKNLGSGFTIIESLMVIFVFGVITAALLSSIVMIYRTHGYSFEQAVAIDEARRGVDIMAREIRKATYGENGAHPIEKAAGKEFVFYSDIDDDGAAERVRYYLGLVETGTDVKECVTLERGGDCTVLFPDFFRGNLKSATVKVSTEGYYNSSMSRYAAFAVDGTFRDNVCYNDCHQCYGAWEGTKTFDVTSAAADKTLQFNLNSTNYVRNVCNWQEASHAMKAKFELSWTAESPELGYELKKGVIEPVGTPAVYPPDQEKLTMITNYVRNAPPIFSYYDASGNQIMDDPSFISQTTMMKLFMVVNVNPDRAPADYDLEQYVQLRNLKEE